MGTLLLASALGFVVAAAFMTIGMPALVLLAIAVLLTARQPNRLPGFAGLGIGSSLGVILLTLQAEFRCAAFNRREPGLEASCTPGDISGLLVASGAVLLMSIGVMVLASRRTIASNPNGG